MQGGTFGKAPSEEEVASPKRAPSEERGYGQEAVALMGEKGAPSPLHD